MSYRLASLQDTQAVETAFIALEQASPAYGYSRAPSWRKGMALFQRMLESRNAYILDERYLLLVAEGVAWHSYDTCLEEVLVLKLNEGRGMLRVGAALEAIARERGVNCILASDSSINFRMGAVYKRAGFRPITITYYKELSWDNGSLS
jgi:hypothetical protein